MLCQRWLNKWYKWMNKWEISFWISSRRTFKECAEMHSGKPHLFENKLYFLVEFTFYWEGMFLMKDLNKVNCIICDFYLESFCGFFLKDCRTTYIFWNITKIELKVWEHRNPLNLALFFLALFFKNIFSSFPLLSVVKEKRNSSGHGRNKEERTVLCFTVSLSI